MLTTSVSLVGHSRGGGEGDTEDPGKVGAQATAKAGLCISVCVRWRTWGLWTERGQDLIHLIEVSSLPWGQWTLEAPGRSEACRDPGTGDGDSGEVGAGKVWRWACLGVPAEKPHWGLQVVRTRMALRFGWNKQ